MDYCWKCGSPMSKNSTERVCTNPSCGRTVQRHKNTPKSNNGNSSSGIGDVLAGLLGIGILGLAFASLKNKQNSNDIDTSEINAYSYDIDSPDIDDCSYDVDTPDYSNLLKKAERKQKRSNWVRKHKKGIIITALVLIASILLSIGYHELQLLTPIGNDSSSLEGLKYTEVVQKLKEYGFTNIRLKEISDLTLSREDEENIVTEVKLFYTNKFSKDTQYPSNFQITVVYHTVELYSPPLSSKEAKGMNYKDVIKEYENAGFINIKVNVEYDIITGWVTNDGEVKSVTINGEKKYDSGDKYRLDAEIVITYHTWISNKPD